MPLSNLQQRVLSVIAAKRDPESYVAGGVPLNRAGPRISSDIDIFHDREERVQAAADADAAALAAAGFATRWLRRTPSLCTLEIREGTAVTRLDWAVESDYRFFPAVPDPQFGYVLHDADLAMNKVSAAANRRVVRDAVDLVTVHERILSLGAAIWAACDRFPGWSPEGLINEIRRTAQYRREEFEELEPAEPIDPAVIAHKLRAALASAEEFVLRMPTEKAGLLFLEGDRAVQPDPARLADYIEHRAQRRGHWPSSPEIAHAMLQKHLEGKR
jgi:hypothetical protein